MALEFGFYDSYDHDRVYSAQNMNDIFEGVIKDGVYAGVGDEFVVKPGSGLQITVGTGRAWYKMTWNRNRVVTPIPIDRSDPVYSRIDTVCIRVRKGITDRQNDFYIYKGTIQTNPSPPIIIEENSTYYLPLANVTIRPNATDIKFSDIEILVGKSRCPYVTSIIQQTDITKLFNGWNDQFDDFIERVEEEFESFDIGEVLTKLTNMVDKRDKAVTKDLSPASDEKWMTPYMTDKMISDASSKFSAGVQSFKGRTGAVTPADGDYTATQVGALPITGGELTGELRVGSGDNPVRHTVYGILTAMSTLQTHGDNTFTGKLTVGRPSATKPVVINGTLDVSNAATLRGGLDVTGDLRVNGVPVGGLSLGSLIKKVSFPSFDVDLSKGESFSTREEFAMPSGVNWIYCDTGIIYQSSNIIPWSNLPNNSLHLISFDINYHQGSLIILRSFIWKKYQEDSTAVVQIIGTVFSAGQLSGKSITFNNVTLDVYRLS